MAYPVLAPNSTWYKSSTARSTITQINIVDSYTATGSENESWNADTGNTGAIKCYRSGTVITIAGNGSGKIAMNADSSYAFSNSGSDRFSNLTKINNAILLDTSKATTFERLFYLCKKLESVDVSNWNTENVTNMNGVFNQAMVLKEASVENWVTSAVTSMEYMFQLARGLETLDLSKWDVSNVTTMKGMFQGHSSVGVMNLTSIGNVCNWNTGKVQTFYGMFQLCELLETVNVSNWDTGTCTDMSYMFNHCTSLAELDVSDWNTGACTCMSYMFNGCTSLEELDVATKTVNAGTANAYTAWNVSKVTDFSNMFCCGSSYGEIPMKIQKLDVSKWDTSSATDMSFMLYGCQGCKTLDVYNWNVSKVTNFDHMFAHSYLTVNGIENWATSTAAVNLNCMFHSLKNKTIDVSKFNTSNVQIFSQMFQDSAVSEIIGLENLNTSNGFGFDEMFLNCTNLKELNLSSFDTTKAKDGVTGSTNGHLTTTLMDMFTNMPSLEKITFGEKFSFNGDGTTTNSTHYGILPTPSTAYILNADGNWHTVDGDSYAPNAIPSLTAGTYYADTRASEDYLIKGATLIDIGRAIKKRTNTTNNLTPENMIEAVDSISINASSDSNGNVVLDIAGFLVSEINGNVAVG